MLFDVCCWLNVGIDIHKQVCLQKQLDKYAEFPKLSPVAAATATEAAADAAVAAPHAPAAAAAEAAAADLLLAVAAAAAALAAPVFPASTDWHFK